MSLILIRYGELALKSHKVRRRFEEHLLEGISRQFEHHGLDWIIEREQGRIFLHTSDENQNRAIDLLTHIPGIFSVSPVKDFEITRGMESILDATEQFARGRINPGQTFRVSARRAGSHAFTSQEAAALAGERILETIPDLKVKLKHPEVTIFLEIRGKQGFLFTSQTRGMGGLPPGSQGKVLLLLSGPNSMVAGYLMMKRGCRILPVHFDPEPREDIINETFPILRSFDPGMKMSVVQGPMSGEVIRRMLRPEESRGLVTGVRFENWTGSIHIPREPLFQPLMGLDDDEIAGIAASMKEFHQRSRTETPLEADTPNDGAGESGVGERMEGK